MRRLLFCVPMISLLLLTGCDGRAEVSRAEQRALELRGQYLEMTGCTAHAALTADYGQRVYSYEMDVEALGEEVSMTLTAPETVAGITARTEGTESLLEYEDLVLETGPLDGKGLTPVSAVPVLLETARSGYITTCSQPEDTVIRIDCGDPEEKPGAGREVSLWLDEKTGALLRGEISQGGFLVIACDFFDFTIR